MTVTLEQIVGFCDRLLATEQFADYCPNGLQVQGRPQVQRLLAGVTASQALLDAAVAMEADAVLVHHGYFWKGEAPEIVGIKQKRLQTLLAHDISLIAYHLPLDAHAELGNNVLLGQALGWTVTGPLEPGNPRSLGLVGTLDKQRSAAEVAAHVGRVLGREPLLLAGGEHPVQRVAWCSGAAQDFIELAAAQGVDLFLSGEVSERTTHLAAELGVHYLAAGHHATERFGVQALAEHLAREFGLRHYFIDLPNPV